MWSTSSVAREQEKLTALLDENASGIQVTPSVAQRLGSTSVHWYEEGAGQSYEDRVTVMEGLLCDMVIGRERYRSVIRGRRPVAAPIPPPSSKCMCCTFFRQSECAGLIVLCRETLRLS